MNLRQLIIEKEHELLEKQYVTFSDEEIQELPLDHIYKIVDHFHGHALMKLPPSEIKFFEWLTYKDKAIWDDIWGAEHENEYLVSIDLLKQFVSEKNGFPICDLENEVNYYFTSRHIKIKGIEELENIIQKTKNNEKLKVSEFFLLELQIAPTDIWHFAFRYNLSIPKVKEMIETLVYKGFVVHLSKREDLITYIDI